MIGQESRRSSSPSANLLALASDPSMTGQNNARSKVLPFAAPQPSREGALEKWFRGVIQSNHDLIAALERLRDSYQMLIQKPASEADQAVLLAVEITLSSARNAQTL
ncbi:MAG: hypothetical protein WA510_05520 [Acidobacteriaceae bacterium]|jgi:hypothetical protein